MNSNKGARQKKANKLNNIPPMGVPDKPKINQESTEIHVITG